MPRTVIPACLVTEMQKVNTEVIFDRYKPMIIGQPSLKLVADMIWCAINDAHNTVRNRQDFTEMILTEECANSLNIAAVLELAGPVTYNYYAKRFQEWVAQDDDLEILFDSTFETTGFENQMMWMEEVDFSQPALMNNIFVVNRRRFVDDTKISGKGELFEYMLAQYVRTNIDLIFRLTRQIILANGGTSPIDW